MKRCPGCAAACWDTNRHCPSCGADVSAVAVEEGDPFIGTTLVGKYQLLELVGVGAMGRVYRALHLGLDTQVAVKVLNAEIAADPVTVKRFQNEARAASRLHHPNAIAILDFGQASNGTLYLVMELLRGRTLAQMVTDDGPLPAARIADLLGQALAALDEAHAAGIIHRDFKPENIFVETLRSGREHVKVLDFGIAKLQTDTDTQLTSAGLVCGTPDYMSPEQIRGLELDARSDVYSAGVVLYESLTGRKLFEGLSSLIDVLQAHLFKTPEPPQARRPDLVVPPDIEAICLRALAKDANERFGSALELRMALEAAGRSGRNRCPKCGAARQAGRFCAECGAPLPSLTPYGGVPKQPLDANFGAGVPTQHDASLAAALAPAQGAPSAPPPEPVPRLPPPTTLPFCGREAVLSQLGSLDRRVALLVGEPGIGKTSVAQAWADRRRAAGRRVVYVEADGPGLIAPLQALRRAVGMLLALDERPDEQAIVAALGEHLEDRAGLAVLFGADRGRSPLPLDVRRRECRAAILAVLRRGDADFVFDDLHLYDTLSRALIEDLAVTPGSATVLATSSRAEALGAEGSAVVLVRLTPLDDAELLALGVTDEIIERAEGNAFAVDTALRATVEQAAEPTTAARLQRLSPEGRRVAELLAVASAPLHHAALEGASGLSRLDAPIAELAERGLLAPTRGPYRLSSPTLRREIYELIDVERRRAMHARLGAVLDRAGDDVYFVAYHALLSGDGEPPHAPDLGEGPVLSPIDGISALERAGVAAREAFDDAAASRALRAAMERCRIAQMLGLGEDRQLVQIELKLGLVLRYGGDLPAAEAVLREAAQLAQQEKMGWAVIEARRGLARVCLGSGRNDRARAELNTAVKAALAMGDTGLLCETYLDLGDVMVRAGTPEEAARELDEGILLVTQGDGPAAETGPEGLASLVAKLAEVKLSLQQVREADKLVKHALRLSAHSGRATERARIHALAARVSYVEGRAGDAATHRRNAVDELRSLGDRRSTAEQLLALADETPDRVADPSRKAWLLEAERLAGQVDWPEGTSRSRERLQRMH